MSGILLDTHVLYWLVSGEQELSEEALVAIGENQETRTLFVSPITAWELSLAAKKRSNAPQLGDVAVGAWFREAVRATGAKIAPIIIQIAIEAAEIVTVTGHKDPGDCYILATARTKKLSLVSRDAVMMELGLRPGYLDVIRC